MTYQGHGDVDSITLDKSKSMWADNVFAIDFLDKYVLL